MQFEPFLDRLSRDVRNDLASTMIEMLAKGDVIPAQKVADSYLEADIHPGYKEYIQDRLERYRAVLKQTQGSQDDVFRQALVLWDHGLFFEVHEVLEHAWKKATGPEKDIYQAMIRAAGVYIKLEFGYTEGARKMADHALPVLTRHRKFLAKYFQPEKLLKRLKECNPVPPQLLS